MGWFVKRPFKFDEDAIQHMVALLSEEGEKAGTPLTRLDREILGKESSRLEPIPEELQQKAKALISRIFEAEPLGDFETDPKSFGNSLQWAGDSRCPNIVTLSEEVALEIRGAFPPTRGWKLVKDRAQLTGCAILAVLLVFAAAFGASILFGWK